MMSVHTDRIRLKRIYEKVSREDGQRVLVDRIWPRGVKKEAAKLDDWVQDIAPSKELRQWFDHRAERWEGFRNAYRNELAGHPETLRRLMDKARRSTLTLLFAAKDTEHNQAVVLREVLLEELQAEDSPNEPSSPACYADGESN